MNRVFARTAAFVAAAGILVLGGHGAKAEDPLGLWKANDGQATFRIAPCGAGLCGTIAALAEPNDPATGRPKTDVNNPDAAMRVRPVVGLTMLRMTREGENAWRGTIYNGQDGRTYNATMASENMRLKVTGCVLGGLVCRTQIWSR
jgi:uncharacterized protein (DUF2147 family)